MEKSPLFDSIFYFQLFATAIYTLFLIWVLIGLNRLKTASHNLCTPFVSIIVAARNEEKNIGACLNHLLRQDYPTNKYEIVVVDDHSDDNTLAVCQSFASNKIKLLSLGDIHGVAPKKAALRVGIEASQGDIIMTTDADCRASQQWISTIIPYFNARTAAVASWLYVDQNSTLLSRMESLDSLSLSFVAAAGFGWRTPFMANGANFAYRRDVYDELNGFDGIAEYVSGDDDLLLQKIHAAERWETAFAPDWHGHVATSPNTTFVQFLEQRFRWASKSSIHPRSLVVFEVFVYLYLLSFPIIFFALVTSGFSRFYFFLPFLCKYVIDLFFMNFAARRVKKKIKPLTLLLTEWLQIFYVVLAGIGGLRGTYTWKGRRYTKGRVKERGPQDPLCVRQD